MNDKTRESSCSEQYVLEHMKELELTYNSLKHFFMNKVRMVQLNEMNNEFVFHIAMDEGYTRYARNLRPLIPNEFYAMLSDFVKEQLIEISRIIDENNRKKEEAIEREEQRKIKHDRIAQLKKELRELENE